MVIYSNLEANAMIAMQDMDDFPLWYGVLCERTCVAPKC
jgi:hypothetical protein